MSRRKSFRNSANKRSADPRYGSDVVAQMVCMVMKDGKKQKACSIVWQACERLYELNKRSPQTKPVITNEANDGQKSADAPANVVLDHNAEVMAVFMEAVQKASPVMELVSRRLGGANIQQPVAVRSGRKVTLALRSIIKNARSRISQLKSMSHALAQEMYDILKGSAKTLDDKENMFRMAKANAVFMAKSNAFIEEQIG